MLINYKYLVAAAHCASTDPTRYYLNGVAMFVRNDHVEYVATDGYVLLALRHRPLDTSTPLPSDWPESGVIVANETIKQLKTVAGKTATLDLTRDGQTLTFANGRQRITALDVDGTFPDWRVTLPHKLNDKFAAYDPSLLIKFVHALKALGNKNPKPVVYRNGGSPALVSLGAPDVDGFGVVMPFRTDAEFALPTWI